METYSLITFRALLTSIGSICLLFYYNPLFLFSNLLSLKLTLGSVFGFLGLICMLHIIKTNSLLWLSIYNLIGIALSGIYLIKFENISLNKNYIGIILISLGYIFNMISKFEKKYLKTHLKNHLLSIFMILFFSISSFIHWKNLQKDLSPLVIVANQELTVFILGLIFVFLKNNKIKHLIEMKHQIKSIFIMALIIFMALNFSFFGLKITNPLISSMISLSGPFITMFLGVLFFKEPITKLDLFSIFLISLGILRLSN